MKGPSNQSESVLAKSRDHTLLQLTLTELTVLTVNVIW